MQYKQFNREIEKTGWRKDQRDILQIVNMQGKKKETILWRECQ